MTVNARTTTMPLPITFFESPSSSLSRGGCMEGRYKVQGLAKRCFLGFMNYLPGRSLVKQSGRARQKICMTLERTF